MQLLTRDEFRKAVFERDGFMCVICGKEAQDAHHIMERRLWVDGGYYLNNGASLCSECHLEAERTTASPEYIRKQAGIQKILLPPHLYPDYKYDKWGNIVNVNGSRHKGELFFDESVQKALNEGNVLRLFTRYVKYPRTLHLPFSLGRTNDDRVLPDCSCFENQEVVITEKMDGENTTGYDDGHIHARSLDSDNHASRTWVKNNLSSKLFELPHGYRICGENLFARHSIGYSKLPSYFLMFSVWNMLNDCLSWDDTLDWAAMLDLHTVQTLYRGVWDMEVIRELAGNVEHWQSRQEGFVVRLARGFKYGDFQRSVGKFVRKNHVQTNQHWLRTKLVKNELDIPLKDR